MIFSHRLFAFFILLLLSGCVVGQKYNYHEVMTDFAISGSKVVGLATTDQRSYVLSGGKDPDVVGLLRAGFGNPYNVKTESEKPLASDVTQVIASSLSKKGLNVVPVIVSHNESIASVMDKLKATNGENLILVTLYEWKSDTYVNVGLTYDMHLQVFDKNGTKLAENVVKGSDNLGGSAWNPVAYSKTEVPAAFKKKIEELFNNPSIIKALQP